MICINQRRAKVRAARQLRTPALAENLVRVSRRRTVLKRAGPATFENLLVVRGGHIDVCVRTSGFQLLHPQAS
jgi:hypothetical protein